MSPLVRIATVFLSTLIVACGPRTELDQMPIRIQLNWLHDPTFTGEYILQNDYPDRYQLLEGGPNVFPVAEVLSGRADFAVVGADIFLKSLADDISDQGTGRVSAVFVDFQRNPVGWVLHPDVASRLGLTKSARQGMNGKQMNNWLFDQIAQGKIQVGDKRGTETTAIWSAWVAARGIDSPIELVPVGFDASVVLEAPSLIFPVYLNEEPFKLSARLGAGELMVFDPVDDGVRAYGNVIIAKADNVTKNSAVVEAFVNELRASWGKARDNQTDATSLVFGYYDDVSESTLQQQIAKTLEFVYFETSVAGVMDSLPDGKWDQTISQLVNSGSLPSDFTLETVNEYIVE